MTIVNFYDEVDDSLLKFAVIVTKTDGKWVFCKHKMRNTWEIPGGHREPGECITETAKRELYEETGAKEYDISPVCAYSVTAPENFNGVETFGMLFFADVFSFEEELHSEIEKIKIMEELPTEWTYPDIHPRLLEKARQKGFFHGRSRLFMDNKRDRLIEYIAEVQSIAQSALFYVKDEYDKERFERLRDISAEMMAIKTELPLETVKGLFCSDYGYQTPKVDTRAAIFRDNKILLVHEKNGTWSLPGGWCDFNMSPVENTIKETKEEAGRDIRVKSVISVQNRDNHNVPAYAYAIVKIFYLCEETGGSFEDNLETTEIGYFSEDELPDLALEKCNEEQIHMCFEASRTEHWSTQFD